MRHRLSIYQDKKTRHCTPLSSRELEVAAQICLGKTTKEIAGSLHLSAKTVSTYLQRIAAKLKVKSFVQIALWMVKHKKVKIAEIYVGVDECFCECHCHKINGDYNNPKVTWPSRR